MIHVECDVTGCKTMAPLPDGELVTSGSISSVPDGWISVTR